MEDLVLFQSSNLAQSDFYLFEQLIDALREKKLPTTYQGRSAGIASGLTERILCQRNQEATRKMVQVHKYLG